jgi:hypothetical protein
MRLALRQTLSQIRDRHPRDFGRVQALVREILPLPAAEEAEGTIGRWEPSPPRADDPATWDWGTGDTPGVLFLSESAHVLNPVALVAHELGHACTTLEDRDRRGACWTAEWAEELAADWYAYKWGFGRIIARNRRYRNWMHHGAAPRSTFAVESPSEGVVHHYRVTRNFCVRLVRTVPSSPDTRKGKPGK